MPQQRRALTMLAAFVATMLLLAGCDSASGPATSSRMTPTTPTSSTSHLGTPPADDPRTALDTLRQRRLRQPQKARHCPITAAQKLAAVYGRVQGRGPVYPVSSGRLKVPFPVPSNSIWAGSSFSGFKVRWIVSRGYAGPVLVRGFAWRGDAPVKFDDQLRPFLFSRGYTPSREQWHEYATWHYLRFRRPGCYAVQIDGRGFSRIVVFRVLRE